MPVDIVAEWRRGCWKISNRSIRCRTVSCSVCLAQNIPIARFFFFRTDSTRNILKPVVATLVHQLMNSIPELRPIIIQEIQTDPLIFTKSFKTQFQILIFGPLLQLQSESLTPSKTVVLLFDGVDECDKDDEQSKVIRVVTNFVRKHSFPMIAFFGSRAENHLCIEFRSPALSDNLLQLPLDTDYRADEDIRRFLLDSFTKIKATHPFGHDLRDSDWPAPEGLDDLVRKASGQFIYASVVLKFISTANQDPAQLLEIVRGLRPSGRLTPFAQLDALYRHIFSKVADIHVTSLVLAWKMFTVGASGASAYPYTQEVCGAMSQTEIKVALAALISVISFTDYNKMHFLHASLPDFLQDQKRSQVYYIDRATWSAQLSILTLRRIISNERSKLGGNGYPDVYDFAVMVGSHLAHANPTAELREHIAALGSDLYRRDSFRRSIDKHVEYDHVKFLVEYVKIIQKWDFGDGPGGKIYDKQRKAIKRYCRKYFPEAKGVKLLTRNTRTKSFFSYFTGFFRRSV